MHNEAMELPSSSKLVLALSAYSVLTTCLLLLPQSPEIAEAHLPIPANPSPRVVQNEARPKLNEVRVFDRVGPASQPTESDEERTAEERFPQTSENAPAYCHETFTQMLDSVDARVKEVNTKIALSSEVEARYRKLLFAKETLQRMTRTAEDDQLFEKLDQLEPEVIGQSTVDALDKEESDKSARSVQLYNLRAAQMAASAIARELKLKEGDYERIVSELAREDSQDQQLFSFYARGLDLSPEVEERAAEFLKFDFSVDAVQAWADAKGGFLNLEESVFSPDAGEDGIDWEKAHQLYNRDKLRNILNPTQFERYLQLQKQMSNES